MTIMARTVCVSLVDIIVDVHFKIIYTTLYFCHFFHEECVLIIITLWGVLIGENFHTSRRLILNIKSMNKKKNMPLLCLLTLKQSAKNLAECSWPSEWHYLRRRHHPSLLHTLQNQAGAGGRKMSFWSIKKMLGNLQMDFSLKKKKNSSRKMDRNFPFWVVHLSEVAF